MTLRFNDFEKGYEAKPTAITYGYDRHERSWCIIVEDQRGNEYESHYLGTKDGCMRCIDELKQDYSIADVVKLKAY